MYKFIDTDLGCFAMLNVASAVRHSPYEGANVLIALKYYHRLLEASEAAELGLTDEQLRRIRSVIQSLMSFQEMFTGFERRVDDVYKDKKPQFLTGPPVIDLDLVLREINRACETNEGECYIPSGWIGTPSGHFVALKVKKISDTIFWVSAINLGAGNEYHQAQAQQGQRVKYDYESDVYAIDVSQKSGLAFFNGVVTLVTEKRIQATGPFLDNQLPVNNFNQDDLYGLMELYGELKGVPERSVLHAKTRQRTGTCTLTNTHAVAKDILIEQFSVDEKAVKRFSFLIKQKALSQAFDEYNKSGDDDKHTIFLVLKRAVEKQYVRIAKLYPEKLTEEDYKFGMELCDKIKKTITTDYQERLERSSHQALPPIVSEGWDEKIKSVEAEKSVSNSLEVTQIAIAEKRAFPINPNVLPVDFVTYLQEAKDHFEQNKKILTLPEIRVFVSALPKTSGVEKDEFWDLVVQSENSDETTQKILIITELLNNILNTVLSFRSEAYQSVRFEIAATVYDITAQLVQNIPRLTFDGQYALQLSDVCSELSLFEDAETYYTIKAIYENFARRCAGKKKIFSNNVKSDKQDHTLKYLQSLIPEHKMQALCNKDSEGGEEILKRILSGEIRSGFLDDKDQVVEAILLNILSISILSHQHVSYTTEDNRAYYPSALIANKSSIAKKERYDALRKTYRSTANLMSQHFPEKIGLFTENSIYFPTSMLEDIRRYLSADETSKDPFDPSALRPRYSELPYEVFDSGTFYVGSDYWEAAPDNAMLDEDFRSIMASPHFQIERVLGWALDNVNQCHQPKVRDRIFHLLFQFGKLEQALKYHAYHTLGLINQFIQRGLHYCKAKIDEGERGEVLSAYTWFCTLQVYLRNHIEYAVKIHQIDISTYRWHDTTDDLFKLFQAEKNSEAKQEIAQAMLFFLFKQFGRELPEEKIEMALSCYMYGLMDFMGINKSHFSYCNRALSEYTWFWQRDWFMQTLQQLEKASLNKLANALVKTVGADPVYDWILSGAVLATVDDEYRLDLFGCQWYLNGHAFVNCNIIARLPDFRAWIERFGIDVDATDFQLVHTKNKDGSMIEQLRTVDGKYAFTFRKTGAGYILTETYRTVQINDLSYRLLLAVSPDEHMAPMNLGMKYEDNRREISKTEDQFYWISEDREQSLTLFETTRLGYEGVYLSIEHSRWVKLESTPEGLLTTDIILFDMAKEGKATRHYALYRIENQFRVLTQAIGGERDALVHAKIADGKAQVIDIRFPVLNLDFILEERKFFCQQYPGYYLSDQKSLTELNGLETVIVLKNEKGRMKYLLPNYQFKDVKKNQALTREAFLEKGKLNRGPAYYELFFDKFGQLSLKEKNGWFYLMLIYRDQGDYDRALFCLQQTEHFATNPEEIAELYEALTKYRDDSAVGIAFECKVIARLLRHHAKWSESPENWYTNLKLADFQKTLKTTYQFYLDNFSEVKQGISMIPKNLLLSSQEVQLIAGELGTPSNEVEQRQPIGKEKLEDFYACSEFMVTISSFSDFSASFQFIKEEEYRKIYIMYKEEADIKKTMPSLVRIYTYDDSGLKAYEPAESFTERYLIDLFKLAISDSPDDQKIFKAQLFFILQTKPVQDKNLLQLLQLLYFVFLHRPHFQKIDVKDIERQGLVDKIQKIIKTDLSGTFLYKLPPLFVSHAEAINLAQFQSASYPLHPEEIREMPKTLASVLQADEIFQHPLRDLAAAYFDIKKGVVAQGDFPLSVSELTDSTPLKVYLLNRYLEGHEKNKLKEQLDYSIKSDGNLTNLTRALRERQDDYLARAKSCFEDLMLATQKAPTEKSEKHALLLSAQGGLQVGLIELSDCYNVLLTNDITILTSRNPFLTQADVESIVKFTREYAMYQVAIAQCQEALNIISGNENFESLPFEAVQLLGVQLNKSRLYDEREFPEFLIYEAMTGRMLRDDQVESLDNLIQYIEGGVEDTYHSALLQFAAGGGKTSIIIPLLAKRFAQKGLLPVIFNTSELYAKGLREVPESLQACFGQLIEVIERDLDHQWSEEELTRLYRDLRQWQTQGRTLLLKPVTWHSIHLAYRLASLREDQPLALATYRVLEFFRSSCIKLEDESHITSDPLQQYIKTYGPAQIIPDDQRDLIMRFYDFLMGHAQESASLAAKAGMTAKSKHAIATNLMEEIQRELAEKISREKVFDGIVFESLKNYLLEEARTRPDWLIELRARNPKQAELVVLSRAFIQTVLPYLLTMQLRKDYGYSIHEGDLTAAPKHDEEDVTAHFRDPLVLVALTIQLYEQEGVPADAIKKIISDLKARHVKERLFQKVGDTQAEFTLRACLPAEYSQMELDGLSERQIEQLSQHELIANHLAMIKYFLKQYALKQVCVPKFSAVSTASDLHAGFPKGSVCFSATPGPVEVYPAFLSKEHCYLATDFEAEVISKLLQEENLKAVQLDMTHSPDKFFSSLREEHPDVLNLLGTLIDRGALLSGSNPEQVVEAYLQNLPEDIRAATAHFVREQLVLTSNTSDISRIKIDGTQLLKSLEQEGIDPSEYLILLYLELSRTTGTDVKRPYKDVAGLTIGKEQTVTEVIQAAMRERQLLWKEAQTIVWILFKSLYQTIVPNAETFDLKQVFYWMIRNEARKLHHKILARAYQGIEHEVEAQVWRQIESGVNISKFKNALEKATDISFYNNYELAAVLQDSEGILNNYINDYRAKFNLKTTDRSDKAQHRLQIIIRDTKALIAKLYAPQSTDIHVEVEQEQQQQSQTEVEQQTQQQSRHTNTLGREFRFAAEHYGDFDRLGTIFSLGEESFQNKTYQAVEFEQSTLKFPPLRLNVEHFCPYEQQYSQAELDADSKKIKFLKPIHILLVRMVPKKGLEFVALTAQGVEHFLPQIDAISKDEIESKYFLINHAGELLHSSANVSSEEEQLLLKSQQLKEILAFTSLLNGKVNPVLLSELIQQYRWREADFRALLKEILACSVTHHSSDIDEFMIQHIYQIGVQDSFSAPADEVITGGPIVVSAQPMSSRAMSADSQQYADQKDPLSYLVNPIETESYQSVYFVDDRRLLAKIKIGAELQWRCYQRPVALHYRPSFFEEINTEKAVTPLEEMLQLLHDNADDEQRCKKIYEIGHRAYLSAKSNTETASQITELYLLFGDNTFAEFQAMVLPVRAKDVRCSIM